MRGASGTNSCMLAVIASKFALGHHCPEGPSGGKARARSACASLHGWLGPGPGTGMGMSAVCIQARANTLPCFAFVCAPFWLCVWRLVLLNPSSVGAPVAGSGLSLPGCRYGQNGRLHCSWCSTLSCTALRAPSPPSVAATCLQK